MSDKETSDERRRQATLAEYRILDSGRDQELEQTHELLNFHLNNMPLAIVVLDDQSRITRWSPQAEQLFGWKSDEVVGRKLDDLDIIYPDDAADVAAMLEALISGQTPRQSHINRNLTRDGKVLVCEWYNSARFDEHGRLTSILAVASDITRRTQAEWQLRSSEERFRRVLEHVPDVVVLYGPDLKIRYINPATTAITGMQPSDFIGKRDDEIFPIEQHKPVLRLLKETLTSGHSQTIETELELPGNGLRHLKITCLPLFDETGKVQEILGITRDFTESVSRERQLSENRALLELAGRVASLGGWRIDLESERVTWSDEVAAIHGEPPGTTPDLESALQYFAPEFRDRIRAAYTACVTTGAAYDEELQIITSVGKRKWVRVIGEPVKDEHGSIIAVQGAFQDISDSKAAEEALRRSEERYRYAAEASQAALWEYDMRTDEATFSEAFAEMLGYEKPEDMPETMSAYMELMHPDDRKRIQQRAERFVTGDLGDRASAEFRLLMQSGEYRWFLSNSKIIHDDNGRPIRRLGSTIDIHDRKVAEERTRQLAERLTSTLESITDAFFTLDREWRITYLNRQGEIILQRNRDDLLGKRIWDEFPEMRDSTFYHEYNRAVEESITVEFEEYNAALEAWFEVRAYPTHEGLAVYFRDITESRQAEQQVRLLEATVSNVDDIVMITETSHLDEPGPRIVYVNDAVERVTGYKPEELIGRSPRVLQGPLTQRDELDRIRAALENDEPVQVELINYTRSGETYWLDIRIAPIHDTEGVATHFVAIERDITRRKQDERRILEASERVRASEERFRSVARVTTDVIWDLDLVNGHVWWSAGVERVFGYTPEEAGDDLETWGARVHPDDREAVLNSLNNAIGNGAEDWSEQYRFQRRNGSYAHVLDSAQLIKNEQNRPIRMVGGLRDITRDKEAEQALADSERHYRMLFHSNPHPMWVFDTETLDFLAVNKAAITHYGYSSEEFLSMTIRDIRPKEDLYLLNEWMAAHDRSGGNSASQWRHVKADGEIIDVQISSQSIEFEGRPARLVLAQDQTEKIKLEEQLRQSQRLESIGQLTGGVAHDFNNLLTVILGNAELLVEHLDTSPRLQHLAEMTASAAQRGANLTNRLLAFARRQTLEPEPTDIAALVNAMHPLIRRSMSEDIEIRITHPPDLWLADIDPAQLETALLNLSINARDAMSNGGKLDIEAENVVLDNDYIESWADIEPGQYVCIAVSDTGTGIPPELIDRLFEPFFTTKEKGKGTGLGLPMVYGFIKQSNGHIRIYSEPGEGATVRMYLPRAAGDQVSHHVDEVDEAALRGNEHILVVEDDELVQEHAQRLLEQFGYKVSVATDGASALEQLETEPDIDLLFTDVIMPGEYKGPDLVRAACAIKPDIRVLYTSGYTENAIVHHGRVDAGVHLLQKPYRRIDLARKIRAVLDAPPHGETRER